MNEPLTVYGAPGSGSVPVEAAMTLIGLDYQVIEEATWAQRFPFEPSWER